MKPRVSILIPAFNAEKWLASTLRSAIAQTWQEKEIIIVNDGSSDKTLTIARQFESSLVQVVSQKNQGAAAAKNEALSLSRGDYIQWLDADDLLAPDKIAKQMEVLGQSQSKRMLVSSAWASFIYRHGRANFTPDALWADLSPTEFLLRKIGQNLYMPAHGWLVSRELTEAAGNWDRTLPVDDDGEYFCRVILASEGIRFVPEAKVYYRASGSNRVSHIGRSDKKLECQWRSMQLHIRYLRSLESSERAREACVRFLQNWLVYFYPDRLDIARQVEQMAKELGGQLEVPRLSWKYSWIKNLFGWGWAKRVQFFMLSTKWALVGFWDKLLFRIGSPRSVNNW